MEENSNFERRNMDLCCCCLLNGCDKDIWSQYTWMGEQEVYGTMLKNCFNLTLHKYERTQHDRICDVCVTQLRNARAFKQQVENCQRKMQEIFNGIDTSLTTSKLKIEDSNVEKESNVTTVNANGQISDDADCQLVDDFVQNFEVKVECIELDDYDDNNMTAVKKTRSTKRKLKREKYDSSKVPSARKKRTITLDKKQRKATREKENIGLILEYSSICPFKSSKGHFNCFYCNKPFVVFEELREHTENDHKDINSVSIRNSIDRPQERPVKADTSKIICKICNQNQTSLKNFIDHLPQHDKTFDVRAKAKPIDCILGFILNNGRYICSVCDMEFKFFKNLSKHMNDHTFNNVCDVCGKCFLLPERLRAHSKLHENVSLKCEKCDKLFVSSVLLRSHVRYAHTDKKFMCSVCEKSFKSYRLRIEHLVEVHNSKRPEFKCDICLKLFRSTGSLNYHIKSEHMKIRRQAIYNCEECGKCFTTKFLLKSHILVHTGERNYECEFCHKKYTRAKTLKEHSRIHFNDRRFSCSACGQSFIQKCSLKNHIRVHHPNSNIAELIVCKKSSI